MWHQIELQLPPMCRGFHLITEHVVRACPHIHQYRFGLLNIFIKHTSASLCINENADPTVRQDFEAYFNHSVPDNTSFFEHTDEGPDDMPAHLKSSLLGCSVTIPITDGRLNLGTWQGIYLGEHRNFAQGRHLVITLNGR
ncbi:MAG TPA: secondary thiamine-phosphate synthase enzyme YjbQ [Pseudomonadales bacterium]|nr:secondary thiamine-phosphate synthase enzyme YjbQ [Pseudomonadales bacterium]